MSLSATNILTRAFRDGEYYNPSDGSWESRTGSYIAGCGYAYTTSGKQRNYVMEIQFTIETPASEITLALTSGSTRGSNRTLNYIILPAENVAYEDATYDMERDGTITMSSSNYTGTTATLKKTLRAGTYYVYLWTSLDASGDTTCFSQITNNGNGYVGITYEELEGAIRIGDGSTNAPYLVYIGDGSANNLYMAYVGNGSTWDLHSG